MERLHLSSCYGILRGISIRALISPRAQRSTPFSNKPISLSTQRKQRKVSLFFPPHAPFCVCVRLSHSRQEGKQSGLYAALGGIALEREPR
jgi:hypothetical protein